MSCPSANRSETLSCPSANRSELEFNKIVGILSTTWNYENDTKN
ncbi:hypothetical protein LEP1GSC133_1567 [Leptospira borgpetersenii serovar Pomona str. 200901868]|uniref:Uncharacterized protein n=1 Tax=Leptospira borgpetersenii serovar Pomona str. 200901868 TaxID=1192866 RepID=M6WCP5_LEPBO|nr:hypothetical protein LEP1GSC133_1567 [Leptospira borgpetersenii serovar Pomona str. 200901868]